MFKFKLFLTFLLFSFVLNNHAVAQYIPQSYSGLKYDQNGKLVFTIGQQQLSAVEAKAALGLSKMLGQPKGTETGIAFDFGMPDLNGTLYYGFIHFRDSRHPLPVFFKRTGRIKNGRVKIDIKNKMSGKYDMIGWEETGYGTIGYRVANEKGQLLYEGKVAFKGTGPFEVLPTVIEGPFVNLVTPQSVVISFVTSQPVQATVTVGTRKFADTNATVRHEIPITGLEADRAYSYTVRVSGLEQSYSFKTAPAPGSRKPFTFAYASDSRSGQGGGERDIYGVNAYMVKKIMAMAAQQKVAFVQFTGDLINGYRLSLDEINLQYANWKHAVEPFAHYFPVMAGMGNHEALMYTFRDTSGNRYSIDRFPYEEQSAEAAFALNFVNPLNGPQSEDGAVYDPNPNQQDFPGYKENVFYYTYDNVAVVVMNSNYWYAPSLKHHPETGGNLHGYIMDRQMEWLAQTLAELQKNPAIDHIFITEHTPFFPNGGHVKDDMWYGASNKPRAVVAGKPVKFGIIERRDQLLDIVVNRTPKVVAILTGDEHNYCRTEIGPGTNIYPEKYDLPKIKLSRTVWQINNGAAGAPYYAQEQTPWSDKTRGFTTQNAVVFFRVNGKQVKMEVYNPDTLEPVDELQLR